jgi:hypothetical protein
MTTNPLRLQHARMACRGFGSVPVSVGGNPTAPDGQPRRGLLRVPETVVDDGTGTIIERAATLRIPSVDVPTVVRGNTITVDGVAWQVRDVLETGDGAVSVLVIAKVG